MHAWSLSILAEYGRNAGLVIFFAVLYLFHVYCVLLLAEGEIKRIVSCLPNCELERPVIIICEGDRKSIYTALHSPISYLTLRIDGWLVVYLFYHASHG